jgi:hypothetical protein
MENSQPIDQSPLQRRHQAVSGPKSTMSTRRIKRGDEASDTSKVIGNSDAT